MSYSNNTVGIIIPVYNGKEYVCQTIESCLDQEYEDIDILIVDDCSTDSSYSVIEDYIKKYNGIKKIRLIKNEENIGVLRSCNKAAEMVNTAWILFLGQDDLLPANYIKTILSHVESRHSFAFCNPIQIDKDGNEIGLCRRNVNSLYSSKSLYRELSKECVIASTGLLINHNRFNEVNGFDTLYRNYGEWNLWIRLLERGEYLYVDSVHSFYRRHNTNMTNSFMQKSKAKELQKYWNSCRKLAQKKLLTSSFDRLGSLFYYIKSNVIYWIKTEWTSK